MTIYCRSDELWCTGFCKITQLKLLSKWSPVTEINIQILRLETLCFAVFPLNSPPNFHSLWGWLDFTQTCLARRVIFLTAGLTIPISRAATAHSEWTSSHKLAAGGELERTGGRALTHLWRWFSIDHWQPTSKTPLWTWQAASGTAFESSAHFYQEFMVYLEVIFFAAPGIWFDCTSHRWHGNSRRSHLDVDNIWDLHFHECLMLFHMAAVDFSAFDSWGVLKKCCTESPPRQKLFICPDIY